MARHVVAQLSEIPAGHRKVVKVEGREIAILNVQGKLFAVLNRCPHEGASLCFGAIVGLVESDEPGHYRHSRPGELLRCPWHGWEFDLSTGQSLCDPKRTRVKSYPVYISEGRELVHGPYKLETFAVSVAEKYVILEA